MFNKIWLAIIFYTYYLTDSSWFFSLYFRVNYVKKSLCIIIGYPCLLIFNIGVKKYGNNWKMLESLIKTRNAVQIRSHAQKFFNRIKEEFNTEEPLKYVWENSWEEFQLYRFDNFKQSSDPKGLSNKALELNNMNKEGKLTYKMI